MKLVITSAFIDPNAVGEPRWCYDLAKGLSERVETIVISQTPLRKDARVADFLPMAKVYEHDGWQLDFLDKRINSLIKPNYLKYHAFALKVLKLPEVRETVTCGHHFGPLGMRYPTPLRNSGIPYILGPVGGSLKFPSGFGNAETKDPWYYSLRDFDSLRFRFDPLLRASYQTAECLIGAGNYVEDVLKDIKLKRFLTHSQRVAPEQKEDILGLISQRQSGDRLRLFVASRLIFSKGIHYALRALAQVDDKLPPWSLDIAGDGHFRNELQKLSADLGLSEKVFFHGHISRAQVDDFYRRADICLFPTIREPSGAVIFEAMSWGVPLITADYGGPATHVLDEFGIRASVSSPQSLVDGIAHALLVLGNSPDKRRQMGEAAVRIAREKHSIAAMVDFYMERYQEISR